MKRALLIPLGLAVLLVTAAASAASASFVFNTSGFDFTDYTQTAGYIGFSMAGNQVQVTLTSSPTASKIPAIALTVPGPTTSATGATVYPGLANLGTISVVNDGSLDTAFTVTHDGVTLDAVTTAYVNAFEAMGFKATVADSLPRDLVAYTFSKGGLELRAVFHRDGANVTAHLSSATAA